MKTARLRSAYCSPGLTWEDLAATEKERVGDGSSWWCGTGQFLDAEDGPPSPNDRPAHNYHGNCCAGPAPSEDCERHRQWRGECPFCPPCAACDADWDEAPR